MIQNFTIADLNLRFEAETNAYFDRRLSAYRDESQDFNQDVYVRCNITDTLSIPKGERIGCVNGRHWLRTADGGYASFDYNTDLEQCLATVRADKAWADIRVQLYDVKKNLGTDTTYLLLNMLGEIFRFIILKRDGIVIHASSIAYHGNGLLFSAPSGTGKSTHTGLWKKYYPDTVILNDDTPAIRLREGTPWLYGTPWSGKTELNCNENVQLKGIIFLRQSPVNRIEKLDIGRTMGYLINEIRLPLDKDLMDETLRIVGDILEKVPAYILHCNMEREAVDLVKGTLGV